MGENHQNCIGMKAANEYPTATDFHRWRINANAMRDSAAKELTLERKQYFKFYQKQFESLIQRYTGMTINTDFEC